MQTFHSPPEMQAFSLKLKQKGQRIGLVPTMGYLHEGHLSLLELARKKADVVGASIFVNPTQFGPKEDFSSYPRDEKGDLEKLQNAGCNFVFLPTPEQMYPEGFQTSIHLSQITQGLCGKQRPGHFDGVATVVLKLFNIVQPDVSIFGEKDYQQLAMIRQMAFDLNLPAKIVGAPIMRSPEGLALSSRNVYLSESEKNRALVLWKSIQLLQSLSQKEKNVSLLLTEARKLVEPQVDEIDYLEIVDAVSLKKLDLLNVPARYLMAVKIGKTRLIDNASLIS